MRLLRPPVNRTTIVIPTPPDTTLAYLTSLSPRKPNVLPLSILMMKCVSSTSNSPTSHYQPIHPIQERTRYYTQMESHLLVNMLHAYRTTHKLSSLGSTNDVVHVHEPLDPTIGKARLDGTILRHEALVKHGVDGGIHNVVRQGDKKPR